MPTPLAPLADTHGHLTVFRSTDPAEALARAILVGVQLLVVPLDPTEDVPDIPRLCHGGTDSCQMRKSFWLVLLYRG